MKLKWLFALAVAGSVSPALATTYNVSDAFDVWTVAGTITTDGKLGFLTAADITDFRLVVSPIGSSTPTYILTPINGGASVTGPPDLTATPGALLFDYTPATPPNQPSSFSFAASIVDTEVNLGWSNSGIGWNFSIHTCLIANCFVGIGGDPRSGVGTIATADAATPLPGALPLFATGLGALGAFVWRRKRKTVVAIATP